MKKLFTPILFALLSAVSFAQCTSCTINITGNDAADHSIGIGQVLCVQATGRITGHIYIGSGGKLCNQGHIDSHEIGVSAGGEFDNYGVANIDTFYLSGPSTIFTNEDSMTMDLFYTGANVAITNNGTIASTVYGDTATTFTNNGNFKIKTNIYIGDNSQFSNYRKMHIGGNFYNGPLSDIRTTCVIAIDSGWYNNGTIKGPLSGCGGFTVGGLAYNSGTIDTAGHIDICVASHPAGGIDGSSTPLTGVTFCQCTDTCTDLPSGIKAANADLIDFMVYPNPASEKLQVQTTDGHEANITIQSTIGQTIYSGIMPEGTHQLDINTSALSSGLYLLTLESNGRRTSRRVEVVR